MKKQIGLWLLTLAFAAINLAAGADKIRRKEVHRAACSWVQEIRWIGDQRYVKTGDKWFYANGKNECW